MNHARKQGAYRLGKTELELRKKQGRGWTMPNESKLVRNHARGVNSSSTQRRPQTASSPHRVDRHSPRAWERQHHDRTHDGHTTRGNHGGDFHLEPVNPFLPEPHISGDRRYIDGDYDEAVLNVDWNASTKLTNPARWGPDQGLANMASRRQMCSTPTVKGALFSTPGFLSTHEEEIRETYRPRRARHDDYAYIDSNAPHSPMSYDEMERLRRQEMQGTRRPQSFYKGHADGVKRQHQQLQSHRQSHQRICDRPASPHQQRPMPTRYASRPSSPGRSAYGRSPTASSYGAHGQVSDRSRSSGYQQPPPTVDDFHDTVDAMEEHMATRQQQYQHRQQQQQPHRQQHHHQQQPHRQQQQQQQYQRPLYHDEHTFQERSIPAMRNTAMPLGATMAIHPQLDGEYGEYSHTVDMHF